MKTKIGVAKRYSGVSLSQTPRGDAAKKPGKSGIFGKDAKMKPSLKRPC